MKIWAIVSIFILTLLSSCAEELPVALTPEKEFNHDAVLYYSENEWPIACYFFDPKAKNYGQSVLNDSWVWAKTDEGAYIHGVGYREGGYLALREIFSSKGVKLGSIYIDFPGSKTEDISSIDQMEAVCQRSIDNYYPNKGYKLISMIGLKNTTATADTGLPLLIAEEENPNAASRLVIFGDSLSDTGRLKRWVKLMPERPFFLGRFTNGGTWSDFLSKMSNLAVLNYSVGGAVTRPNISSAPKDIIKYIQEIGRYFVTGSLRNFIKDYVDNELVRNKVTKPDRTIFVLWGGANDFLSKFDDPDVINSMLKFPERPSVGSNAIINQTVLNIMQEIRGLFEINARNIVVANLPDIGKTPSMKTMTTYGKGGPEDQYEFAEKISAVIQKFNETLKTEVDNLKNNPDYADKKIIYFDAADALNKLMSGTGPDGETNFNWGINLAKSFTHLSAPGKPDITVGVNCYKGGYLGSTKDSDVCDNADEMLFFDLVHPTFTGHCGIAFMLHKKLYEEKLINIMPTIEDYRKSCR